MPKIYSLCIVNQYVCVTVFICCLSNCAYVYNLLLIKEMQMYPKITAQS